MRSREEQIKALAYFLAYPQPVDDGHLGDAENIIDEAIQCGRELERPEMGRDTARLDWIERHRATQAVHIDGSGWHIVPNGQSEGCSGHTFREAVDKAMAAEGK